MFESGLWLIVCALHEHEMTWTLIGMISPLAAWVDKTLSETTVLPYDLWLDVIFPGSWYFVNCGLFLLNPLLNPLLQVLGQVIERSAWGAQLADRVVNHMIERIPTLPQVRLVDDALAKRSCLLGVGDCPVDEFSTKRVEWHEGPLPLNPARDRAEAEPTVNASLHEEVLPLFVRVPNQVVHTYGLLIWRSGPE